MCCGVWCVVCRVIHVCVVLCCVEVWCVCGVKRCVEYYVVLCCVVCVYVSPSPRCTRGASSCVGDQSNSTLKDTEIACWRGEKRG